MGNEEQGTTDWFDKDVAIGEFALRPYIAYQIITIKTEDNLGIVDLKTMYKYYNTIFLTPLYNSKNDENNVDKVLIPFLQKIVEVAGLKWDVRARRRKGLYGVLIPLRLYFYMGDYIQKSKNKYPLPVSSILFIEED